MTISSVVKTLLKHELFLILLFLLVFLRIPNLFEPYWYGDEAIYLVLGQGIQKGLVIYRDIIDHKTPIIYFLAAVPSQFWFKFLLIGWTVAALTFFYAIALKLLSSKKAAVLSTALFMLATTLPAYEGNIANGELFVIGFILAGAYIFTRTPLFQAFLEKKSEYVQRPVALIFAGALFSLGLLTKIPALFDIASFFSIFLFMLAEKRSLKTFRHVVMSGLLVLIGILIPVLLSIAYFASQGALDEYRQFGLLYNFRYSTAVGLPFTHPLLVLAYSMAGKVSVVVVGIVLMLALSRRVRPAFQLIFTWSLMVLFATLLSSRPYPHYWLQTVPPIALLIGYFFTKVKSFEKIVAAVPLILLYITVTVFHVGRYSTVNYYANFLRFTTKQISLQEYRQYFNSLMTENYATAEYIKKTTMPDTRLFIWGNNPMLYTLANRLPVGRFTVAFHIKDFNAYEETLSAVKKHMPPIVIVMNDEKGEFGSLYAVLAKQYVLVQTSQNMHIYRRITKQ